MRRLAIPVTEGKLSEFFGSCSYYEIFKIDHNQITSIVTETPTISYIEDLPGWAAKIGITDIVTFKIDKRIITMFTKHKINLYIGVTQNIPQKIAENYILGKLQSNSGIINEILNQHE